MVQKEVAERMQAGPGTKDYGALSLAVQYRADTYIAANVPPNCFMPRPNVGSCVIRLTKKDVPPVEVKSPELMFKLIRAAFNQRRKTLLNAIANSGELSFSKEEILEALKATGIHDNERGEKLGLTEFGRLADVLL
jgi:16S rRNA (adenine1518-N6/adenine1519-N6)-dimethyltransferase